MAAEPSPAQPWAEPPAAALDAARHHLERLGYRLLETHTDRRFGAHLIVARARDHGELLLCELRTESLTAPAALAQGSRRRRLRRAAAAWLAAHPQPSARALRLDRLTVIVGHDGGAVGIEHHPDAF